MIDALKDHLKYLAGCCLQHPGEYDTDIEEVISFYPAPQDGSGGALWRKSDGTYGVLNESQDYTGHG